MLTGRNTSKWDKINGVEYYNIQAPTEDSLVTPTEPFVIRNSAKHYKMILYMMGFLYLIIIGAFIRDFDKSVNDFMELFSKSPFWMVFLLLIFVATPIMAILSILDKKPRVTITNRFIETRKLFLAWSSIKNMYFKQTLTNHGTTYSLIIETYTGEQETIDFYGLPGTPEDMAKIIGEYYYPAIKQSS